MFAIRMRSKLGAWTTLDKRFTCQEEAEETAAWLAENGPAYCHLIDQNNGSIIKIFSGPFGLIEESMAVGGSQIQKHAPKN